MTLVLTLLTAPIFLGVLGAGGALLAFSVAWLAGKRGGDDQAPESASGMVDTDQDLRRLLDDLPGMAYRCRNDTQWTMLLVSDGSRELTGYTPEELIDNQAVAFQALVHPDDREQVSQAVAEAQARGEPFDIVYRLRHRDGHYRWVQEFGSSLYHRGEQVLQGFISDITARDQAESQRTLAEIRYRTLAEHLPGTDAHLYDTSLRFQLTAGDELSQAALTPADMAGCTLEEGLGADLANRLKPIYEEALAGRRGYQQLQCGGKTFGITTVPLAGEDGTIEGGLALTRNITEETQAAQLIQGQNQILRRISRGDNLDRNLDAIVALIRSLIPDYGCLIRLRDTDAETLVTRAHDGLPDRIVEALRILTIRSDGPTCSRAAFHGAPIQTDAIEAHEGWADFRDLMTEAGLHSCRSIPVRDGQGTVRATIALFGTRTVATRQALDNALETAADLAGIALERERTLRELNLAASSLAHTAEAVVIYGPDNRIIKVNPAFTRITGYSAEEVIGEEPTLFRSGLHDEGFYQAMARALRDEGHWQGELWRRRRNGELFPALLTATAVHDADGELSHIVDIFSDITQFKAQEERLQFLAYHDPLTHLPNRLLFQEQLTTALARARRGQQSLGLLFVDVDHFKSVNDSISHGAGDDLLAQVAQRLEGTLRKEDVVARQNGDEFTVLLPELTQPRDAGLVAEKIREAMQSPFIIRGQELFLSVSIGITCAPEDGLDAETLLSNADSAMSRAKQHGRDTYQFFSAEMNEYAVSLLDISSNLRRALHNDEFELHYQPVIDLDTREIGGVEALLRWARPGHELVMPGHFIPVAEQTGLIHPIGAWVLRRACEQLVTWQAEGKPVPRVAVNVSAQQFRRPDFVAFVAETLEATGLSGHHLELEITESTLIDDPEQARETLQALKAMDVHVAIDDFGTGYSSLSYLKQYPLDRLKIDRSFLIDIPDDPDNTMLTRTIISMAKSLGIRITAEGIENEAQLAFLQEHRCDEGQGFLLGYPEPASPD